MKGEMSTHYSKKKGRMRGGEKIFINYKGGGNWDGKKRTKTDIQLVPNESANRKGKNKIAYSTREVEKSMSIHSIKGC